MEYLNSALISKFNLKELKIVLTRFDEKPVSKNELNIKFAKEYIDDPMENYKLKYNLKDLKVILRRCDEEPPVKNNFKEYNYGFSPFAVDINGNFCSICLMEYTEKKKLFDHVKMSMEDSLFRCKICNISLPRNPATIIDLERDWTKRGKCNICSVIF